MADDSEYVLKPLREEVDLTLYRGRERGNQMPILAVAVAAEQPSPQGLRRLEHEYSLATELDAARAAHPRSAPTVRTDVLGALILASGSAVLGGCCGCLMVFLADGLQIDLRLGHPHAQVFHGGGDDLGHNQVAEPFVVGGDDVPRRIFGAGLGENVLKSLRVIVP